MKLATTFQYTKLALIHSAIILTFVLANVLTATAQAPTPTNSPGCCYCVYPNPGEKEHEGLKKTCDEWLEKSHCAAEGSFAYEDFSVEAICEDAAQCNGNDVLVEDTQHGPQRYRIIHEAIVCIEAFPECNLTINSGQCLPFADLEVAVEEANKIAHKSNGEVTLCGKASYGSGSGLLCTITHKIIVSPGEEARGEIGDCAPVGSWCNPPGSEFPCLDENKNETTQMCCDVPKSTRNHWAIPGHPCNECSKDKDCGRKKYCNKDGNVAKPKCVLGQCSEETEVCGPGKTCSKKWSQVRCRKAKPTPTPTVSPN